MKKMLLVLVVVACALFGATAAFAAIAGSAHDFSYGAVGYYTNMVVTFGTTTQVGTDPCLHCHTPHAASTGALWNRSRALVKPEGGAVDPRGSGTCIACHDGDLSDSLVNAPGRGNVATAVSYTWTVVSTGNLSGRRKCCRRQIKRNRINPLGKS